MIRDAMKDKGRVALARIVFANREHILAIEPWGKGMLGTTLRYDYEIRDEKKFFKGIPSLRLKKDMVELAGHILDRKAGHFDPEEFKDEYELALRKLVRRKAAGHTIETPRRTACTNQRDQPHGCTSRQYETQKSIQLRSIKPLVKISKPQSRKEG